MAYKIVDTKGRTYSLHETIEDAERELQTLAGVEIEPATTFMGRTPPYRIVQADRVWEFNLVTNRYEWMAPRPVKEPE